MNHTPRWPNGPAIGLGVAEDMIGLTYGVGGRIINEAFGGLHARLYVAALRARLLDLQPSAALLCCWPDTDAVFESGALLGTAIGIIAAMGVLVEYEPLPSTVQALGNLVLH